MIFDVIIRDGFNDAGKQIINVYRIHKMNLGASLRMAQDNGKYIISVIPLVPFFKRNIDMGFREEKLVDPIDPDAMIDPHGF